MAFISMPSTCMLGFTHIQLKQNDGAVCIMYPTLLSSSLANENPIIGLLIKAE